MKANELMIGDWVSAKISQSQRQILKVEDIYGGLFNAIIWYGYEIRGGYDIKDATPIPLTAEILEKNGFIVNGNKYRYSIFELIEDSMGDFFFKIGSNVIYFFHVHKLQHALRLCGLNDLAYNFKV